MDDGSCFCFTLSYWCIFASGEKSYFVRLLTIKRPLTVCSADCCGGKLLNSGVNGEVLRVIRDMCAKAKSCVKTRHGLSQFFCLKRRSVSGGKFVASFVFALFE